MSLSMSPLFGQVPDRAGLSVVRIGIDRDNDTATGCDFDPGTGVLQAGVDVVLEMTVDSNANPPMVLATVLQSCSGGGFGNGIDLGGGWDVGLDNGLQGGDVIEAVLPLDALGPTQAILVSAGATDANGQDDTNAALFTFAAPIPTLGFWGMFALIAALTIAGIVAIRRRNHIDKAGPLAMLLVAALLLAAFVDSVIQLDGQVDDWTGIDPLITDPSGEVGVTDATDILAVFVCPWNNSLFVRVDVVDLENDAPLAVDDVAQTPEDTPVTVDVLANDSDPDGDAFDIVAVTQPDGGSVTIDGAAQLGDGGGQTVTYTPDENNKGQDTFTYTIEDPAGAMATATVTVTIGAQNDPPTALALDNDSVLENQPVATLVGTLSTTDPDSGDSFTYSLVAGAGDDDNGSFQITTDRLETAAMLDFEAGATRSVRVRTTDSGGLSFERAFTIRVLDQNDPPTAIQLSAASVAENEPLGTLVGTLTTTDQDPGQTFAYSLVSGPGDDDNASFSISGDRLLTAASFDFETQNSLSILVQSDDQARRAIVTQTFTVNVTDVVEGPDLDLDDATPGTDFAASFTEDGGSVAIVGTLTIDQTVVVDIQSATVSLTNVLDGTDEVLAVTTGATAIAANYDPGTGVLALTGADTAADYQIVLRTLTYDNANQDPDETARLVTVVLNDGTSPSNTATSTVTVAGTNDDPTAVDDALTVQEDSTDNSLAVLANDSDAPDSGETLTITAVGTPDQGGSVVIAPGATSLTYTPVADFAATETFTYTIGDGNGGTATATVTIDVSNVNDDPTANDDAETVDEDSVDNVFSVLANDVITPDSGETLTITDVVMAPKRAGTIDITGGGTTLTYTPDPDFFGTDVFTYTISDGNGGTDTATLTVTVNNVNDDPVAVDDMFNVTEDAVDVVLSPLANDGSGPDPAETLIITATGTPDNGGSVTITGGGTTLTYSPAMDFMAVETFTYTISDGNGGMATGTVTVQVDNLNDPPVANADSFTVDEDSTANNLDVLANDEIAPDTGETLTVDSVGPTDNGGVAVVAGGGTRIDYTPATNFVGTETFDYTVTDGGLTDTNTVTVTVADTDDPVTAQDDLLTAGEDAVATTGDVLANDDAPDGGLAVQSVDAASAAGAAISNNGNGTFDFDPTGVAAFQALDDGESAPDSFDYLAEDTDGDTDTGTVNVTVNGANDAPVADATTETTTRGGMVVITLTGSDVDVESLTFAVDSSPNNGSLGTISQITATSAQVTYTHDNTLTTTDSFTFTASDGTVDSPAATVSLTINDAPTAVDDGSVGSPFVVQRDAFLNIDVAANDTDAQGDGTIDLSSVVPTNGTRGTVMAIGGGIVTYTANAAEIGADTFSYTIDDDMGATSNSATVFVVINDPPMADDDMVAVSEADAEMIAVLTGDTDSDDMIDVTTVSIVTDVPGGEGTTMVNADGTVTYDPGIFTGSTSFTYTVMDTRGGTSNEATVSITVSPDPMAMADSYTVFGHTTVSVPAGIGLLANDTDDGTIAATTGTFATDMGGSITIAADGSFSYTTPGPGAAVPPAIAGTDTYTYEIEDDVMGTDTAVITFIYEKVVWFVDNTNASGTDDGSQADPFDTLAEATAAAGENETIFIFVGDGTTTGQEDGILLQNGQELFGEPVGLSVDVDGMGPTAPIELVAASMTKPVLTNTMGDVVVLADDNTIEGLELQPQASAGIAAIGIVPMKRGEEAPDARSTGLGAARMGRDREPGQPWHLSRTVQEPSVTRVARSGWYAAFGDELDLAVEPRAKAGGTTTITDVDINPQNNTSDGLVILGQEGTLTITDVTITGPGGGSSFGLDYEFGMADLTVTNLTVTDMGDCVFLGGNTGTHLFTNLNVSSGSGFGLTVADTDSLEITGTNTLNTTGGETLNFFNTVIGASGVTFDSVTSATCDNGIVLDGVSGGAFGVTGAVMISDMVRNGIDLANTSSDLTFGGAVTVNMVGDDGIDLNELTGTVNFNGTISVTMPGDDGLDIQECFGTTLTFADTVTLSGAGDVGVELNGPSATSPTGTVAFMGTLDIDDSTGVGIFGFDNFGTVSFATVDIDTVGVGGVILDDAVITTGHAMSFTQLDIDAGAGSLVGMGIANNVGGTVDVNGGTIENVDGEVIGLIGSAVTLTYTGTLTQGTAGVPLVLSENADASTVTFESGAVLQATGGTGLQFVAADGSYTFDGAVSVSGNDDEGIDIGAASTGTFTFNDTVTLNTGTGTAFTAASGTTATVHFNGGLDIDTTTGTGFQALGGTLNLVDPAGADNTLDASGAATHLLDLDGATVGANNLTFTSITGAVATTGDGIDIDTLGGNGFSGGIVTLAGSAANGIDIATSSASFSFAQASISGTVTTGINLNTNTGTVTFSDLDVNVTGAGLVAAGGGTLDIDSGDANAASIQATSDAVNLDGMTLGVNLSTLNATGGGATRGIDINNCSGSFTVDGSTLAATTTGIDITASTGTFTFDALDIDVSAGTGLLLSSAGTVVIDSDNSAVTDVDAIGGPAVDIDNTIIDVRFDSVDSTNSAGHGVSLGNVPVGSTGFTSGATTVDNPTNFGLNIDDVDAGTLSFANTAVTNRNGTGIFVRDHEGTSLTFGDVDIANPNNAGGNAVHVTISGGGASTGSIQLDSLDASGTNVTVNRADGDANGVPDNETFDGNGIFLADHSGGFTITGTGLQGDGGTIQNVEGDGISLIRSSGLSLNRVTIDNVGTSNQAAASADNAGVYGIDVGGTISIGNGTISRFQDGAAAGTNSRGVFIRNQGTDFTEIRVTDTTFFNDASLLGDDAILVETHGTVNGSVVVESLFAVGNPSNRSDFSSLSGMGVQVLQNGGGTLNTSITNSTFRDSIDPGGLGGVDLAGSGSGVMSNNVDGCTFDNLFPNGVNNGGMVTLFAGGTTDYDATVNNCSFVDTDGRGGIRAVTDDIAGNPVVDFDITITGNTIDDTDREAISVLVRGEAVPAASGQEADILIQGNDIGQVSPAVTSGREGIEVRIQENAKIANLLMQGNRVTNVMNSTSDETVDIDIEDSTTLNLTILGNTLSRSGSGAASLDIDTEDAGATVCLDLNSANVGANANTTDGLILIGGATGTFNIEDIGGPANAATVDAFIEARNAGTATVTGSFDTCNENP
ncbi:Ig-like domain-containing protein [Sulfidibacter corallicola]|uniref:Tandem-95 repeat protein n=1 Tax=Sulfidibacter corallicola TaxID=2818388 RepID=A0A8A4TUA8_SULCO|nr:Ig-like domain-containing protein [Sulfidibacter corallicola]QTD50115.1 tandem-95 repeat protein [Sulfidibacter corallicola]